MANFIKRKSQISEEWAANFKIDLVNDDTINNPEFFHALKKYVKSNYNSHISKSR